MNHECLAACAGCSKGILLPAIGCADVVHCAFHTIIYRTAVANTSVTIESNMKHLQPLGFMFCTGLGTTELFVCLSTVKELRIKINFLRGKWDSPTKWYVFHVRLDAWAFVFIQITSQWHQTRSSIFQMKFNTINASRGERQKRKTKRKMGRNRIFLLRQWVRRSH